MQYAVLFLLSLFVSSLSRCYLLNAAGCFLCFDLVNFTEDVLRFGFDLKSGF